MFDFSIIVQSIDGELPRIHFCSYDAAWHAAVSLKRSIDIISVVIYKSIPINANEVDWKEWYRCE